MKDRILATEFLRDIENGMECDTASATFSRFARLCDARKSKLIVPSGQIKNYSKHVSGCLSVIVPTVCCQ